MSTSDRFLLKATAKSDYPVLTQKLPFRFALKKYTNLKYTNLTKRLNKETQNLEILY